jgi:hypothetical protein
MGLNLAIGRVIFSALEKFDGKVDRRLSDAEIKQIAGRAGRFKGKFEVGGEGGNASFTFEGNPLCSKRLKKYGNGGVHFSETDGPRRGAGE